jgi:flagellar hook-associated protein 2
MTSVSSLTSPAFSISGLASSIDTDALIQGMLRFHERRINLLKVNQGEVTAKQNAFKSIEARMQALRSSLSSLARTFNGAFDAKNVSSSDEELVVAAGSASATPGSYSLRVNSLAQVEQTASQGFDNPGSLITQGSFQLKVGTGATTTVTIDSSNNTLQGLATAINNSGSDVTASIISDGSPASTQPYRLLLSAKKGGAANTITITNNLADDTAGAFKPVFGSKYVGQANLDASFTGTSAISSNQGAGGYTGSSNNTYTFTVLSGGTVGSTLGIQVAYADKVGANSGTLTLDPGDEGVFQDVAQGIQVKFAAGTLVVGETFSIDAFVPSVQQAASASVTLGSGAGALTIESDANKIDGLVSGVTLDLKSANPSKQVTVSVAADTEAAADAVSSFVEGFNDLMSFIDSQSGFDAEKDVAGLLLGDRSASRLQDEVRRVVSESVLGVNPAMNRLGAIGITLGDDGQLSLDSAKLEKALTGQLTGVTLTDVKRLFAFDGKSSIGGISFIAGSTKTKVSATPYQVDVSQAAEQAVLLAANSLASSTVITNANNAFVLTVDGKASSTITLAAGTYTQQALALEVQAKINADTTLAGRRVTASIVSGKLQLTSDLYGFASEVNMSSGSALTPLGFTPGQSDKGRDVVGKFIVNGVEEQALGVGQLLMGNATNANTADLQVRVTLAASQIGSGAEGTLTVTRGVASKLDQVLGGLLDPVSGRLKSINDSLQDGIDDIQQTIDRQNAAMQAQQESLVRRFVAMESTINSLKIKGDYLLAQMTALRNAAR